MPRITTSLCALLLPALLAGCNNAGQPAKPVGDVIATVNGHDVTQRDLASEARSRGINLESVDPATRAALANFVISRAMLVDSARKSKLDRTPALLADRLRADANIVAQAEIARRVRQLTPASPQEIDAYEKANPQIFADRQALVVNQVQYQAGAALPKGGGETIDSVLQQLGVLHVPMRMGKATLDSASLPPGAVASLRANPTRPVQVNNGPVGSFLTLISATPNPAPEAAQKELATRMVQSAKLDKGVADDVAALRKQGRITVREGYDTPPPAK